MVLYHAINTYQLMMSITHGLLENADDKRVLILPAFIKRTLPQYMELESLGFFSRVLTINYSKYNGRDKDYILADIDDAFDSLLSKEGISLECFEEIYVGAAQYYISIYLINKGKSFDIIEEGAGLVSRHYLLKETIRNQHVLNVELLEEYGLLDYSNNLIRKKLCRRKAQRQDYYDSAMVDFDLEIKLKELGPDEMNCLKAFFRCPEIQNTDDMEGLLITQNFANLNQMSFDAQKEIYLYLADFFIQNDRFYIKPHPQDLMYYKKLFPHSIVIKERFPSELLPYVFSKLPRTIYNISSTGIELIRDSFDNVITFDVEYEKFYKNTLKYYVCLKLVRYMGYKEFDREGMNNILTNNLLKVMYGIEDDESDNASVMLIDEVGKKELEQVLNIYETVIFINSDENYDFAEYISISDIIPIEIVKKSETIEYERIYVFTGSEQKKTMLKKFHFNEKFKTLNLEVNIETMTDEQIYIKTLEGYIRALEKRLDKYINAEEEKK